MKKAIAIKEILAIFILLSSLFCTFARAENGAEVLPPVSPDFSALKETGAAHVDQVLDGLRFSLKAEEGEEARIIQLSGIDIPGIDDRPPSAEALAAKKHLKELLTGQDVILYQTPKANKGRMNRMGHHLAHIVRANDELWIQGAMISEGLAYAFPSIRNPEMAGQMYELETKAREEKRGLWAKNKYAVRTPDNAETALHSFAIVEGRIVDVAETRKRTYLNFGKNWKTDFTISIATGIGKDMKEAGIEFTELEGRNVRVRGWLEDWNGPHIKLDHAKMLELLPETP